MSAAEPNEDDVVALARKLFDAARAGDADTLRAYVDAGAPVDLASAGGDTLLLLAAYHGHLAAVQVLLERGADPNLANEKGQAPLAGAVFKGFDDIVEALVAAGADPDRGTPSARMAAEMFQRPHLLALFGAR